MTKDRVWEEIKKLMPIEQMEIAIEILVNVLDKSGQAQSEPLLMNELKDVLARLRREK